MPGATATSFGADPPVEVPTEHRPHLDGLRALADPAGAGALLTLEAGIAHAEVWIAYWSRLAGSASG